MIGCLSPRPGKNLLSVATLEDAGYTTMFRRGHVFIHSENEGLDNMVLLGERRGRVYMLLEQHMSEGSGWLSDSKSMSEEEWKFCRRTWYRIISLVYREAGEKLLLPILAGGSVGTR